MIGSSEIVIIVIALIGLPLAFVLMKAALFIFSRKRNLALEAAAAQQVIRESEKNLSYSKGNTRFTVLVENNIKAGLDGLQPAQGLSLFVEREGKKFLLDTGIGGEFVKNAATLGKNIGEVDFVFISHGHFDHGGGLAAFLDINANAPVYLSRLAAEEKHVAKLVGPIKKDISIDTSLAERYPGRFRYIDSVTEISTGIFVLPEIGHEHRIPSGNGIFFRKTGGALVQDDFVHEQVLVIKDSDGLIVFSGCCHNGVLNVTDAVKRHFPREKVKAVIGGFHLYSPVTARMSSSVEEVASLGAKMGENGVQKFISGHCTGMEAYLLLKKTLGDRLDYFSTGMEFSL